MSLKTFTGILFLWGLTLGTGYAADSVYWAEFERETKRTGISLINHIQNLSLVSQDTPTASKTHKKEALAYFLATGGKYGFRKTPPTDFEYSVLVHALVITTALYHDSKDSNVDLVQVRRRYGLRTEEAGVQNHLIKAQAIVGYALCMSRCVDIITLVHLGQLPPQDMIPNLVQTIEALTSTCYMKPLKTLSSPLTEKVLKESYKTELTVPTLQTIFSALYPYHFHVVMDETKITWMQSLVQQAFSRSQPTRERRPVSVPSLLRIVFANGCSLERRSDGGLFTNIGGCAPVNYSTLTVDGVTLDARWSDEKILEVLSQHLRGFGVFYGLED